MIRIDNLSGVAFERIFDCFQQAFSGYFVPINFDPVIWRDRWHASRIDWSLSRGAFEGEQMVAMILLAAEPWEGMLTAYNGGTGVIPAYRGRKLVRALYENVMPELRQKQVGRLSLEVLTQNAKALKAYRSVGMEIARTLNSYAATPGFSDSCAPALLQEVPQFEAGMYSGLRLWDPAFESSDDTIRTYGRGCRFFEWRQGTELRAYAVLQPGRKQLLQFGLRRENDQLHLHLPALLAAMRLLEPDLRISNIDSAQADVCEILENTGFSRVASQYEMVSLL